MLLTRIEVGRQDSTNRQFRTLQTIHEGYGRGLGTALSAFLHSEIQVSLRDVSIHTSGGFQSGLQSPTCLMVFRLHPRQERMFLHLGCETVFPLLELLLGGKGASLEVAPRNLTEIEWSLMEEIVRVMVRPLGEAWQFFLPVEFEVESLVSEPSLLPSINPGQPVVKLAFDLQLGGRTHSLEIAVPQVFFDAATAAHEQQPASSDATTELDLPQKLALIEDATVGFQVQLDGPTLSIADLLGLKPGQVLKLDYPLEKPLQGLINGTLGIEGLVVNAGKRRAFQVAALP
jgi:flagellar motor switch protein FliM